MLGQPALMLMLKSVPAKMLMHPLSVQSSQNGGSQWTSRVSMMILQNLVAVAELQYRVVVRATSPLYVCLAGGAAATMPTADMLWLIGISLEKSVR